MLPFAQLAEPSPSWESVTEALAENGLWILLGIFIICGTTVDITKRVLKHRERMAMIEAGVYPDSPPAPETCEDALVDSPDDAIDLRKSG